MSKAKRRARAVATPLEFSRMQTRRAVKPGSKRLTPETLTVTEKRLKLESQSGANVPARVIERMGGGVTGARVTDGAAVANIRPKRKARNLGSEAAASGIVGRAYGSTGDGIKRLTNERIRQNRADYFASTATARKDRPAQSAVSVDTEASRIAKAREDYAHAIGQARARTAAGDKPGADAWMSEARNYRRIFRNK